MPILKRRRIMDKQMKDRYDIVCGMISTGIVLAYIAVILGTISLIGFGIYYCVGVSVLSGVLMMLGGVVEGIIGCIIIRCIKYVNTFFCDVAETVLKNNTRNGVDENSQGNKKNKTSIHQNRVFVYNKNDSQYFSGINQQFGTFAMMTCDNPNGAVAFDNEYDATSFMNEFKLCEKDGWVVKQIKL